MATLPVLLPGQSHGWRSLEGCSPWGREELDTTERLHFHFSLSCIGEGNGNPLQCSCLENPRDGKPGGLPPMGSHRVGHKWSDLAAAAAAVLLLSNIKQFKEVSQGHSFLVQNYKSSPSHFQAHTLWNSQTEHAWRVPCPAIAAKVEMKFSLSWKEGK